MKKLVELFTKYKLWLLAFLKPLGFWGLGCAAMIDAAALPIPLDLIVAGYVWENKKYFYLYVIVAAAGSAIGGLVPFLIGRAGGELFLMKRINRQKYEKLRDRFEKQEFLAVAIPSILPPPTPWKLFVFGAGVFEMKLVNFLLAVFAGRVVRNTITAVLTIEYGPQIMHAATDLAARHGITVLIALLVLLALVALWVIGKRRRGNGDDMETPESQIRP